MGAPHRITGIRAVAACAELAGRRSFTAIGEWVANASDQVLVALGADPCPPCDDDSTHVAATRRRHTSAGFGQRHRSRPISAGGNRPPHRNGARPGRRRGQDQDQDQQYSQVFGSVQQHRRTLRGRHHGGRPPHAAPTSCSPSRKTSLACTTSSMSCPGKTSHPRTPPPAALTAGSSDAPSRSARWKSGSCSPRAPGHPDHSQDSPIGSKKWTTEVVYAVTSLASERATAGDHSQWIRGHWAHREPPALGERRQLRRRPLPVRTGTPTPRHGIPAQPRGQPPPGRRSRQHNPSPPTSRLGPTPAGQTTADLMKGDFAGPLIGHHGFLIIPRWSLSSV